MISDQSSEFARDPDAVVRLNSNNFQPMKIGPQGEIKPDAAFQTPYKHSNTLKPKPTYKMVSVQEELDEERAGFFAT